MSPRITREPVYLTRFAACFRSVDHVFAEKQIGSTFKAVVRTSRSIQR
ncbi:hypothetical protein RBSWK_00599 [Rhodopirellula baltica SWK14]|uniref:Uncharacterized protein n=1 Tax=Rhodopirellula baltica SWK14 TaxID=993516 RepID=L7CQY8_RHOBT|nr:hypothetical protein RBSWK_00599 [Rhodopirellula baltica SWK14]